MVAHGDARMAKIRELFDIHHRGMHVQNTISPCRLASVVRSGQRTQSKHHREKYFKSYPNGSPIDPIENL